MRFMKSVFQAFQPFVEDHVVVGEEHELVFHELEGLVRAELLAGSFTRIDSM